MKTTVKLFLTALLSNFAMPLFSQTWVGNISSDWNEAGNWSPATVPGTGSTVTISNANPLHHPVLPGDISIGSLTMSAGLLNLSGHTLTCSGNASFSGDSLTAGHVVANSFPSMTNMHFGGPLHLEKIGAANNFWAGNNRLHGDSLVVSWQKGTLHLQTGTSSPDSFYATVRFRIMDEYSISFAENSPLYVSGDLVLDNPGAGTFSWPGSPQLTSIEGNLLAENFSPGVPNLSLRNIQSAGTGVNGPFNVHTASVYNCVFAGDFTLVGDSSVGMVISGNSFLGANNLLQAQTFQLQNNQFGQSGSGASTIRAANNAAGGVFFRGGGNKFRGATLLEAFATYPGGVTIQQNYYGADSAWGDLTYLLNGNVALQTNGNGQSYVAGNVIIDGMGASKWVEFTGGTGVSYHISGNLYARGFTAHPVTGVGNTNIYLRDLTVDGTDTMGTFYCYTGDIQRSSFGGNFRLIADSSIGFTIANSAFLGAENLIQAQTLVFYGNEFGQSGNGTTFLKMVNNQAGGVYVRDGDNKFYGDVQWEGYAIYPAGVTFQQNFYGVDSCWGNLSFMLDGNVALTTNSNGQNYVAGDLIIDAKGFSKWIQFTGGTGVSMTVAGNLYARNFTSIPVAGIGGNSVVIHNLIVNGTDSSGTFYANTGEIVNSVFHGNFRFVGDSTNGFTINNSSFLGSENLIQTQTYAVYNSRFGQSGPGLTVIRAANNIVGTVYPREGNNVYLGNLRLEGYAVPGSAMGIQQTYYGSDSIMGDFSVQLDGPANIDLASNQIYLGGSMVLENNGTGSITQPAGVIHFIGNGTSDYNFLGSGAIPSFRNVEINREGGLHLMAPFNNSGTLTLTRGLIESSASAPLRLAAGSAVSGAWDSSFVKGPVEKTGNSAFTFPTGDGYHFAPLSISAPSSVTDQFIASYFPHGASLDGYDTSALDPTLDHVSRKEYWILNRLAGSSAVSVTLSWNTSRSGTVDNLSDLRVARWNGSVWNDLGSGGTTGNSTDGTVRTAGIVTDFSPFTLASVSASNALPLSIVSFDAKQGAGATAILQWTVKNQEVVNCYELERSGNGYDWTQLVIIPAGVGNHYSYSDIAPAAGMNYYRLVQADKDGHRYYSVIRWVDIASVSSWSIFPNPVSEMLYLRGPDLPATIRIFTPNGKLVMMQTLRSTLTALPVSHLPQGVYTIQIQYKGKLETTRFMKW